MLHYIVLLTDDALDPSDVAELVLRRASGENFRLYPTRLGLGETPAAAVAALRAKIEQERDAAVADAQRVTEDAALLLATEGLV